MAECRPAAERPDDVLETLERVIASRKGDSPERSYTSQLLAGGVAASGAKVTEEAGELVAAAAGEPVERVVAEAADLVYHLLVLLACRDVPLEAVEAELARRFGVSGLVEKAARVVEKPVSAVEKPARAGGAAAASGEAAGGRS